MVPLVFEGSLNGELFKEYVTQCLIPTLKVGDIVVMDNLSSHKVEGVMEPIIAAGCRHTVPDLNPIEMMWSENKNLSAKGKSKNTEGIGRGNCGCAERHYPIRYFRVVCGKWI